MTIAVDLGRKATQQQQQHWLYTIAHWSGPPRTYISKADWSMLERMLLLHV